MAEVVGIGSQVFEHGLPDDPTPYVLTASVAEADLAPGTQSGDVVLFIVRTLWPNPGHGLSVPSGATSMTSISGANVQGGALVPRAVVYRAAFSDLSFPASFTATASMFTAVRSQSLIVDTVTLRGVSQVPDTQFGGTNASQGTNYFGGTLSTSVPTLFVDVAVGLNVPLAPDTPPSLNTANGFTLEGSATTPTLMVNPSTVDMTESEFGWFPFAVAAAEVPAGTVNLPTWDFPGSSIGDDRSFHIYGAFPAGRHRRGISVTQGGTGSIRG